MESHHLTTPSSSFTSADLAGLAAQGRQAHLRAHRPPAQVPALPLLLLLLPLVVLLVVVILLLLIASHRITPQDNPIDM